MSGTFDKIVNTGLGLQLSQLNQPHSFKKNGEVATMADWIAQEAPEAIRIAFGLIQETRPEFCVRPVSELSKDELKTLAIEMAKHAPPGEEQLAVVGVGSYGPDEVIVEINRGTQIGRYYIATILLCSQLFAASVCAGKIFVLPETKN